MSEDQLKKLRSYYHSLQSQHQLLTEAYAVEHRTYGVTPIQFRFIVAEIRRIEADFPDLLPPFYENEIPSQSYVGGGVFYEFAGLQSHLVIVLSRLKSAIDTKDGIPVTETRDFSFIKSPDLRKVLERDYVEIQRAFVSQCWKSVIILSGSAIEAILLDCSQKNPQVAQNATKAPKGKKITDWDLTNLIEVCVELKYVSPGVEKLSHSVRQYRNLVHPGNEVRNKLVFGQEEARIALEVLHIVHRDLV